MNPRSQLAVAAAGVTLLSATALHSVFLDTSWIAPVVGAVLAVLVGGELGSRLGQHLVARAVWRFVGSSLATLFYVTAVWAHEGAILGFIPRGHTWHLLRVMFDKAFDEVHDLSTPAPTYRSLMLLTAVGVAAVAIAVDQLSVRAPLIGLPLLALYSVPEWLSKSGTGWIPLALGGGGYVGLLIREGRDRTSRWGRTVTGATTLGRNRSAAGAMSQAGWRIGAVALGVALVVPPLVPDFGHFNLAKGGGVSTSAVVHINLLASLSGSLKSSATIHVLTYDTTSAAGDGEYLRFGSSDSFSSDGFTRPSPVADNSADPTNTTLGLDGLAARATSTPLTTNIAITGQLGMPTLPIPIGTSELSGLQGQWAYQESAGTVFSSDLEATLNKSYTATSNPPLPGDATLEASSLKPADRAAHASDTVVPKNLPKQVAAIAAQVVKTAKATTEYEKALALQHFFIDGKFAYNLTGPPGTGYAALVAFLTTSRQGYCQQFSSAMAIMARTLGIPARVAFGFTTGTAVPGSAGTFSVTNHDAHAWPELYFNGLGWLRFEPTPRADGTVNVPLYGQASVAAIQSLGKTGASVSAGGGAPATVKGPKPFQDTDPDANRHKAATSGSHGFSLPISGHALAWVIAVLVLLLIALILPLVQSAGRRRRRVHAGDPREVALLAWRETMRDAFDLGYRADATDSPRQAARRLTGEASLSNEAAGAMDRMARAVERARYATLAGDARGLMFDAATVSGALFSSAGRRTRLRARMFPPSSGLWVGETASRGTRRLSRWGGRGMDRLVSVVNRALGRHPAPKPEPATEVRLPEPAGRV